MILSSELYSCSPKCYLQKICQQYIGHLSKGDTTRVGLRKIAEDIRSTLNAHPVGQKEENVPVLDRLPLLGTQYKYRETVLFFPVEVRICWLAAGLAWRLPSRPAMRKLFRSPSFSQQAKEYEDIEKFRLKRFSILLYYTVKFNLTKSLLTTVDGACLHASSE